MSQIPEDDCSPCTFFGAIGELEDLCSVVKKRGANVNCSSLGKKAENENISLTDFMEKINREAKRLGFPHISKTIHNLRQGVDDHIQRQARGERLPDE